MQRTYTNRRYLDALQQRVLVFDDPRMRLASRTEPQLRHAVRDAAEVRVVVEGRHTQQILEPLAGRDGLILVGLEQHLPEISSFIFKAYQAVWPCGGLICLGHHRDTEGEWDLLDLGPRRAHQEKNQPVALVKTSLTAFVELAVETGRVPAFRDHYGDSGGSRVCLQASQHGFENRRPAAFLALIVAVRHPKNDVRLGSC